MVYTKNRCRNAWYSIYWWKLAVATFHPILQENLRHIVVSQHHMYQLCWHILWHHLQMLSAKAKTKESWQVKRIRRNCSFPLLRLRSWANSGILHSFAAKTIMADAGKFGCIAPVELPACLWRHSFYFCALPESVGRYSPIPRQPPQKTCLPFTPNVSPTWTAH